jgi:hypothetical protein
MKRSHDVSVEDESLRKWTELAWIERQTKHLQTWNQDLIIKATRIEKSAELLEKQYEAMNVLVTRIEKTATILEKSNELVEDSTRILTDQHAVFAKQSRRLQGKLARIEKTDALYHSAAKIQQQATAFIYQVNGNVDNCEHENATRLLRRARKVRHSFRNHRKICEAISAGSSEDTQN